MAESQSPDWGQLQKALAVEAERGFIDTAGRRYRFSEFLCLQLGKPPAGLTGKWRRRWQQLAAEFAHYPQKPIEQRQHLVAETRRLLQAVQQSQQQPTAPAASPSPRAASARATYTSHAIGLERPVDELPGIGAHRSRQLAQLGLSTVRELLFYYPRDYVDYANQVNITDLVAGETVTVVGTVKSCQCFTSPRNRKLTVFKLRLRDATGQIELSRFLAGARFAHRGWQERQRRRYPRRSVVAASGLVKRGKYGLTLDAPEIEVLEGADASPGSLKVGRILPVYPLAEGVPADTVRRATWAALPAREHLSDPLPAALRQQHDLVDRPTAIADIHFPADGDCLAAAKRRLVFDEFFFLQLGFLQRRRQQRQSQQSAILSPRGELIERFQQLLPFALTQAQQRAINEILADLPSETPMNRLVQGDVGSGKTVVAVHAILAAIQSGYQAALMAPTEVLAEQHYRKLVAWFNQLQLPVELLTGSTKTSKRRTVRAQLETGELPLLVGTHALIQDAVNFQQLGLAVIDEQHRFGVQQRARLLSKGRSPHVLTLTATPIPRTLALTLHGDLDVSQIDELPPGRQRIQTTVLAGKERSQAYELIRREAVQGRQAYIVLPLVEESDKLDIRAATQEHQRLQTKVFPNLQVGLLHGRMTAADKDAAVEAFRRNETQILVSTTVIEVGVDVPNATVMLIENAERFGLSQLHQLRGRVGRGQDRGYCLLLGHSQSDAAQQRLKVLEQSQDGFFIAEMDMRFRGPGEVLGSRQSGLPDFALANLTEDQQVLELARTAAETLLAQDEALERHPGIRQELANRYRQLMGGKILT